MNDVPRLLKEHFRARDVAQPPPPFEHVWAYARREATAGAASHQSRAIAWRWVAVPLAALGVAVLVYVFRTGEDPDAAPSLAHDMALASAMNPDAFFSSRTDALVKDTRFRAPEVMPRTGFKDPFKESFL